MIKALEDLAVSISQDTKDKITIFGDPKKFNNSADLFLGNAGTAYRPLCALLSILGGNYRLDGVERMHERPIKDLVDSLSSIGADIKYLKNIGYPPVQISDFKFSGSTNISIKGSVSSQFLTSLLMAVPLLGKDFKLNIDGELISKPYVDITLKLLKLFNVNYINHNYSSFEFNCNNNSKLYSLDRQSIDIEPDASSASYFFAAAALSGNVRVEGLNKDSIQGDIQFLDVLAKMGADITYNNNSIDVNKATKLVGGQFDCIAIPDAAMTLATMGLFTNSPVELLNINSWKVKETDRIIAMENELRKFGATVTSTDNSLKITPPKKILDNVSVHTYDDHRIAMCFSLVCLANKSVEIQDPKCVNKTYPNFFNDFLKLLS
jgi:3-phosphoshikimate 1-carboxyvinyltransferase